MGALLLVSLLAVVNALALHLYGEAREKVAGELAARLRALGTATTAALRSPALRKRPMLVRFLAELRAGAHLENAFVFDRDLRSVADARSAIPAGKRYDLLQLDARAARNASRGVGGIADQYNVEELRFLGAYFPVPAVGPGAVLYLETPVSYLRPLVQLRLAYFLTVALSVGAVALIAFAWFWSERALNRARAAAARAERLASVGEMAAKVAHEIRNPLAIIRGSAELLLEDAGPSASDRVEIVLDEVQRLDRLVGDFLSLGREIPLRLGPVDLVGLVRDVLERQALVAPGRILLVEAPESLRLEMDADRLRQALLNLVRNACQASPDGAVEVSIGRRPGEATVSVRDHGPGVPPEMAEQIFEPFVSGKGEGSGLGLPVARRFVELHEGRLELVPGAGPGAEFRITLPAG